MFRGTDGFLALGGAIDGDVYIKGAVAQSATTATIDGNGGTLNGVVRPGDTFTVAGDPEDPYTIVTGGVIGGVVANELDITFSPGVVVAGGWPDNAAVDFDSNSIAQITQWTAEIAREVLDKTVMGSTGIEKTLDIPDWRGRATALLDYGDTQQGALIDEIITGDAVAEFALTLGVIAGRQFWGDIVAQGFTITGQRGQLFTVEFNFEGTGAIAVNWKA